MRIARLLAATVLAVGADACLSQGLAALDPSTASLDAARFGGLWDIGGSGLFDATDRAYDIKDGLAVVDLRGPKPLCPTGMGQLVSGRESINEIRFLFDCPAAGAYWLHVLWDGGGSGKEQFEVRQGPTKVADSTLVDAAATPNTEFRDLFRLSLQAGECQLSLIRLSGDGLHFRNIALTSSELPPAAVNPKLQFPTLAAYEGAIGQAGIMLDSLNVRLFAPKSRTPEAQVIFGRLVRAYDELYRIVGAPTRYKIVVYHFPEDSPHFSGGTSNCTIRYGFKNLDLSADPEWLAHRVPHVSGYIEEMAHNFVDATGVQFGWEMVGWSIGIKATRAVADNPIFEQQLQATRTKQAETYKRYVAAGYIFPADVPANLCDRIHAQLLQDCEKSYGQNFWQDFFAEVRKRQAAFAAAKDRDERYRITVECFDRLAGMGFTGRLKALRVSTTTDVKSLDPTGPKWDHRFLAPGEK